MKTLLIAAVAAATLVSGASADGARTQNEALRIHNASQDSVGDRLAPQVRKSTRGFTITSDDLSPSQLLAIKIHNQSQDRASDRIRIR